MAIRGLCSRQLGNLTTQTHVELDDVDSIIRQESAGNWRKVCFGDGIPVSHSHPHGRARIGSDIIDDDTFVR